MSSQQPVEDDRGAFSLVRVQPVCAACSDACLVHCEPIASAPTAARHATLRCPAAVVIFFKQTGDAPILKQSRVKVGAGLARRGTHAVCRRRRRCHRRSTAHPALRLPCCRSAARSASPSSSTSCARSWAASKWCASASHPTAPGAASAPSVVAVLPPPLPPLLPLHLQFVYLNQSFSPSLDERVGVLYAAFAAEGRLIVNYALAPAWG